MENAVTIDRPDVVALIGEAAKRLTRGNKTEAVALAVRRLLAENAREGSLFGAHPGSVRVREGADIVEPVLDVEPDVETVLARIAERKERTGTELPAAKILAARDADRRWCLSLLP